MNKGNVVREIIDRMFSSEELSTSNVDLEEVKSLVKDYIRNILLPYLHKLVELYKQLDNYARELVKDSPEWLEALPLHNCAISLLFLYSGSDLFFNALLEELEEKGYRIVKREPPRFIMDNYVVGFDADDNGNIYLIIEKDKVRRYCLVDK